MQSQTLLRLAVGAELVLVSSFSWAQSNAPVADTSEMPAQSVAIDGETKRLRPLEHEERMGTGRAAAPAAATEQGTRTIYSRTGARGVMLDESFLNFTVVRRNADGSLDWACAPGEEAATKILQAKPVARTGKVGGVYETE